MGALPNQPPHPRKVSGPGSSGRPDVDFLVLLQGLHGQHLRGPVARRARPGGLFRKPGHVDLQGWTQGGRPEEDATIQEEPPVGRPGIHAAPRLASGGLAAGNLRVHVRSEGFQSDAVRMGGRNRPGGKVHPPGMDRNLYDRMVPERTLLEGPLWVQRTALSKEEEGRRNQRRRWIRWHPDHHQGGPVVLTNKRTKGQTNCYKPHGNEKAIQLAPNNNSCIEAEIDFLECKTICFLAAVCE